MNNKITYLFEIIYKANRIVVNYNFEGLVLIGAYELHSGKELLYIELLEIADKLGV